jgi:hypothetical protein
MATPRRFDHDEAVRRHAAGESYEALAAEYGVSTAAVYQAVKRLTDPAWRTQHVSYSRHYQRRRYRRPCVRGCGRLAWHHGSRPNAGVCQRCVAAERATTVAADTLRCSECGEWKPDDQFHRQQANISRRGRHGVCRDCSAAARQRSRLRHRTPCVNCGQPRQPDPRHPDSGLCRACFTELRLRGKRVAA